jgi:hypothetical protein
MASWFRVLGVFVVSVAAACSSSGGFSGGSGSSGDPSSSTPSSPTELCSMYVTCMSHADPAGLGVVLAAYGPNGTCWENGDTTSLCQQACITGIAQEREAGSFEGACPMCATDGDCALAGNTSNKTSFSPVGGGDSFGPMNTPVCSAGTCVCAPMAHACAVSADCCSGDCEANVCTCPVGTMACDGSCLDVTSDDGNCGACGNTCPDGSQCSKGICDCSGYGPGHLACGDECTDVTSDPKNCGACGTACTGPARACESGACSCGYGYALCNGACVDVMSDPSNCGACGATCPAGGVCMGDGSCGVTVTNPGSATTCDSVCSGVSASCTLATAVFEGCDGTVPAPTCGETVEAIEQADVGTCFPPVVITLSCECGTAKAP